MSQRETIEDAFDMFVARFYGPLSLLEPETLDPAELAALRERLHEARRYVDRLLDTFAPPGPLADLAPPLAGAVTRGGDAAERRERVVLEALADSAPHRFQELWDATERQCVAASSAAALVTHLARLDKRGIIERPGRGDYRITEAGQARLAELQGRART